MVDEKVDTPTQTQESNESAAATPSPAADHKISLTAEELKNMIKTSVDEALKNSKFEETRKQAAEYNAMMAETVKSSQASLLKSDLPNGQTPVDYIKGVLDEDNRRRFQHGEGKALYSDKGEDFKKAKIVLLKKMGLTEEEIADQLKDIL